MFAQWSFYIAFSIIVCLSQAAFADEIAIQQDSHGVDYVTGGIGSEEVEALEPYKKQFNLYFLFSEGKAGRVIDNVNVEIVDRKNQPAFTLESAAPRLMLNLPSGKYTVIASYQGHAQRYGFNHQANKPQRIILNWRNAIDGDATEDAPAETATP
ncbi:hypothetical protein [Methylophilus aquaticus]|uniref:Carboxypeptidase regulatory-like domain-containing protein n=1 Tax=Methylophilus aquaticus TaxID=1971610 RepID=A0ABT9JSX1_9PROT|nr:hypothetical protein [Methylophilus aquaticus]MDP8567619.1 hypothetical protein [Methylophilus aquaticus]